MPIINENNLCPLDHPLNKVVDRKKIQEWALVLEAKGIPNIPTFRPEGWTILVENENKQRAEHEIWLYENENIKIGPEPDINLFHINKYYFVFIFSLLTAFHLITKTWGDKIDWLKAGHSSAHLILSGEWWRAATSLTLHADTAHLMANLVLGSIILWALFRLTGVGLGWFLVILSGIGGNLLNAIVYKWHHNSIGASTSIFGAVGILAAIQIFGKYRQNKSGWKRWAPLAAGLALLGFLGAGENTDLGAHLFGFMAGVLFGIMAGFILSILGHPKRDAAQIALGVVSFFIIILSWLLALGILIQASSAF